MTAKQRIKGMAIHISQSVRKYSYSIVYNVTIRPTNYVAYVLTSTLEQTFQKAKTTGEKLLLAFIFFLSLLWISVIAYASFYNFYLPTAEISRPVHLSFSVCSDGAGICSFPSSNVSLTENYPIKEILGSSQVYSVIIDLEIPDTPINRDLGMFMVVLRMFDRYHHISATSMRTALYKYKSILMRLTSLVMWSPLYFFGFYDEKQILSVEMFSSYTDDAYHPSVGATVEIQNHRIQIYSCRINFYARFTGLKYFLYYWPITSAICGISFNIMLCLSLIAVASLKKRHALFELAQTLSQEESLPLDGGSVNKPDKSEKKGKNKNKTNNKCHQSTQTRLKEDDDIETYDIPLIQEPADFGDVLDDNDLDLIAELRHRRVQ